MRARFAHMAALGLFAVIVLAGASVEADCLEQPFEVLWSYPANGEQDVPLDATFWLLSTQGEVARSVSATLNGQPLDKLDTKSNLRLGQTAFRSMSPITGEAQTLDPNTEYTLHVSYGRSSEDDTSVTVRFTTGTERAGIAHAKFRSLQMRSSIFAADHPCQKIIELGTCFCHVVRPVVLKKFSVDSSNTIAWYVKEEGSEQMRFWPSICGEPVALMSWSGGARCYYVYGIDARGDLASLVRHCGEAEAFHRFEREVAHRYGGSLKPELRTEQTDAGLAAGPSVTEGAVGKVQATEDEAGHRGCGGCDLKSSTQGAFGWALALIALWRRGRR